MDNSKAYYDLCIQESCSKNFLSFSNKLVEFGFRTIAINQIVTDESVASVKKKKKGNDDIPTVPQPKIFDKSQINPKLTVLNRLTIEFSDKTTYNRAISSEYFKKYHITAAVPKTQECFQTCCESVDIDIIGMDPLDKSIRFSRKLYMVAVAKNIHFEITYAPAIIDSTSRKNIISKSHRYHAYGKSKNVIVSSGAGSILFVRGPYDIINLGLIFGLSEEKSKYSISSAGINVLNRARGRRMGQTIYIAKPLAPGTAKNNIEVNNSNEDEEVMEVEENEEPIQKKLKFDDSDCIIIDE